MFASPNSTAFLQGMGNVLTLTSAAGNGTFPFITTSSNIGDHWHKVGQYLYYAIDNAAADVTANGDQLSLDL